MKTNKKVKKIARKIFRALKEVEQIRKGTKKAKTFEEFLKDF